jgi:hypothetical protein
MCLFWQAINQAGIVCKSLLNSPFYYFNPRHLGTQLNQAKERSGSMCLSASGVKLFLVLKHELKLITFRVPII